MCAGPTTGSPTASSPPFPLPPPTAPRPNIPSLRLAAAAAAAASRRSPGLRRPRTPIPPPVGPPGERVNGAAMPGADETFPAESRTAVFFGAVTSKSEPLTFEESLRFVKKVKARNYMLYLSLFDILGRTELSQLEAYQTLQLLFRDHPDLHEGLEKFRPPMPPKHAAVNSNLWPWLLACAAVPLVAMSLIPALGNPVLWLVQQTLGEKMRAA